MSTPSDIPPGTRFGRAVVLESMTSLEAGANDRSGRWCRIRCDCGVRKKVRAKHLRNGSITGCGGLHECPICSEPVRAQWFDIHVYRHSHPYRRPGHPRGDLGMLREHRRATG
jgi:hypothetical protein